MLRLLESLARPPLRVGVLGLLVGSVSFLSFRRRLTPREANGVERRTGVVSGSLVLLAVMMLPVIAFSSRGLSLPELERPDEQSVWPPRLSRDAQPPVAHGVSRTRRALMRPAPSGKGSRPR